MKSLFCISMSLLFIFHTFGLFYSQEGSTKTSVHQPKQFLSDFTFPMEIFSTKKQQNEKQNSHRLLCYINDEAEKLNLKTREIYKQENQNLLEVKEIRVTTDQALEKQKKTDSFSDKKRSNMYLIYSSMHQLIYFLSLIMLCCIPTLRNRAIIILRRYYFLIKLACIISSYLAFIIYKQISNKKQRRTVIEVANEEILIKFNQIQQKISFQMQKLGYQYKNEVMEMIDGLEIAANAE